MDAHSPPSGLHGGAPASAHEPSWLCACCKCTRPSLDNPDIHAHRSAVQNVQPMMTRRETDRQKSEGGTQEDKTTSVKSQSEGHYPHNVLKHENVSSTFRL